LYVCNCNGIRERQAREAIEAGARHPAEIYQACGVSVRCGRCVCDMRALIATQNEALRQAAE
jgi:bacterioferritin-associated ferredoxin